MPFCNLHSSTGKAWDTTIAGNRTLCLYEMGDVHRGDRRFLEIKWCLAWDTTWQYVAYDPLRKWDFVHGNSMQFLQILPDYPRLFFRSGMMIKGKGLNSKPPVKPGCSIIYSLHMSRFPMVSNVQSIWALLESVSTKYWGVQMPSWKLTSQLTFIFFRGVAQPPTRNILMVSNHQCGFVRPLFCCSYLRGIEHSPMAKITDLVLWLTTRDSRAGSHQQMWWF